MRKRYDTLPPHTIWWQVIPFEPLIKPLKISRVSEESLWVVWEHNGACLERIVRRSNTIHPTWEGARDHVVKWLRGNIQEAQTRIARDMDTLDRVLAMTPPISGEEHEHQK